MNDVARMGNVASASSFVTIDGNFALGSLMLDSTHPDVPTATAAVWDKGGIYRWEIADAAEFAASNNLAGGHFAIDQRGSDLVLSFVAVPEPTSPGWIAVVAFAAIRRRRPAREMQPTATVGFS